MSGEALIAVVVNGELTEVPASATVASVMAHLGHDRRGTAVAVNGEVAPRSLWNERALADGDRVEVLTVAQGG